jgi:hypothetical protein
MAKTVIYTGRFRKVEIVVETAGVPKSYFCDNGGTAVIPDDAVADGLVATVPVFAIQA